MAITVQNLSRGNYVLGGPGRLQGGSAAEGIDAGIAATMAQREASQRMAQNAAEEQRRAQQFQLGLQDRAAAQARAGAAAARESAREAATRAFIESLGAAGGTPQGPPAPGVSVGVRTPVAPITSTQPLGFSSGAGTGAALGANVIVRPPVTPIPPVQPLGFNSGASTGVLSGGAGTNFAPGGAGTDQLAPPDERTAFQQDIGELYQAADAQRRVEALRSGAATGQFGPGASLAGRAYGYFADTPAEAAERAAMAPVLDWFNDPKNQQLLESNPALLAEAEADPVAFVARRTGAATLDGVPLTTGAAPVPLSFSGGPRPARDAGDLGQDVNSDFNNPTGVRAGLSYGKSPARDAGDLGQDVNSDFNNPTGVRAGLLYGDERTKPVKRTDGTYVRNAAVVIKQLETLQTQRDRLEKVLDFHAANNNATAYAETLSTLDTLDMELGYAGGMAALAGVQRGEFTQAQASIQSMYPDRVVELRPYTDGTVDIVMNGELDSTVSWDDVAMGLRDTYDRDFIAQQAEAQAKAQETMNAQQQTLFDAQVAQEQTILEAQVAQQQALIDADVARQQTLFEKVTDAEFAGATEVGKTVDGEPILQMYKDGELLQFTYTQVPSRDPVTGDPTSVLQPTLLPAPAR